MDWVSEEEERDCRDLCMPKPGPLLPKPAQQNQQGPGKKSGGQDLCLASGQQVPESGSQLPLVTQCLLCF